jgi:UDP-N-acetylmuramoyl-L-alanyl-D-glutamate--2,6-diaminopimelate ligase/murE/murF fusion protein
VKLSNLLKAIAPVKTSGPNAGCKAQSTAHRGNARYPEWADCEIGSIHYRAQEVQPGGLFVAIPGRAADGHDFIGQALEKGADAVITQKKVDHNALIIQVPDSRRALADLSARFYGDPSQRLEVIGITGTNGKTTCAYLIESILEKAGCRVGVIGTINYRFAGKAYDNPITTPESLDLQRILAQMLEAGITHVVMEASSHAIDLYRIRNCWMDVALFTNLTQDHLDFHGDMQSYWSSKKRLFTEYLSTGPKKDRARAVINCSNASGRELAAMLDLPVIRVGLTDDCTISAAKTRCDLKGISGMLCGPSGDTDFTSPLVGAHNLENIICAAGAAAAFDLAPDTVKAGVEAVHSIPGRLERIENDIMRFVYVDYAHTPDALENVICALQAIASKRIICIFGCGGDRDTEKRPLMGEIAGHRCDLAVVTSDNPRSEDPMAIIAQILAGVQKAGGHFYSPADITAGFARKGYVAEPDRRKAIQLGVALSQPGDTVLIAGKGHETYQILGKTTIAFDDREEARTALGMVVGR